MPALLTSTDNPPNASAAASTTRATSVSSAASPGSATASPPAWRMLSTVSAAPDPSRSTTATRAPCSASTRAVARPMPLPPPLTSAARPSTSPVITPHGKPLLHRSTTWWSVRCSGLERDGRRFQIETLPRRSIARHCSTNLLSEAREAPRDQLPTELADVLEVVDAITVAFDIRREIVAALQEQRPSIGFRVGVPKLARNSRTCSGPRRR